MKPTENCENCRLEMTAKIGRVNFNQKNRIAEFLFNSLPTQNAVAFVTGISRIKL